MQTSDRRCDACGRLVLPGSDCARGCCNAQVRREKLAEMARIRSVLDAAERRAAEADSATLSLRYIGRMVGMDDPIDNGAVSAAVHARLADAARQRDELRAALMTSSTNYDSLLAEVEKGARMAKADINHAGARGTVSGIVLALSTLPPPTDPKSIQHVLRTAGVTVAEMIDAGCVDADIERFGTILGGASCPACGGDGFFKGPRLGDEPCRRCRGTGEVSADGSPHGFRTKPCLVCEGKGLTPAAWLHNADEQCPACRGTGRAPSGAEGW